MHDGRTCYALHLRFEIDRKWDAAGPREDMDLAGALRDKGEFLA